MTVRNVTRDSIVAQQAIVASSFWTRAFGMIGRRFTEFDGMIFHRCGSIHTWFMSMAIDVVFLDRDLRVVGVRPSLKPWRMSMEIGACSVIELPAGRLNTTTCLPGDIVSLVDE